MATTLLMAPGFQTSAMALATEGENKMAVSVKI